MSDTQKSVKRGLPIRRLSTGNPVTEGTTHVVAQVTLDTPTEAAALVLSGASQNLRPIAVSIRNAAQMSGLSRSFLYEEIARQRLRSVRKRGRRLILIDDLQNYLSSPD
jgi:excisionase family DNA binding protein